MTDIQVYKQTNITTPTFAYSTPPNQSLTTKQFAAGITVESFKRGWTEDATPPTNRFLKWVDWLVGIKPEDYNNTLQKRPVRAHKENDNTYIIPIFAISGGILVVTCLFSCRSCSRNQESDEAELGVDQSTSSDDGYSSNEEV